MEQNMIIITNLLADMITKYGNEILQEIEDDLSSSIFKYMVLKKRLKRVRV